MGIHCSDLVNRRSNVNRKIIEEVVTHQVVKDMSAEPTQDDTTGAVKNFDNNKVLDIDVISMEILTPSLYISGDVAAIHTAANSFDETQTREVLICIV
ncbi:Hypothetical predicted protein [Octopus vulgaris]|uniref:Uncharacterized protein n=1 Tax=Octopus vulgaris TaxID=6645 RepID=A0AA36BGH8_OCTVU|nr:Hypothetical predicted protein [Octopus vulgaris]